MKNKWKRVLSAALVCMMILALLPASALAAEDAETAETEIAAEEETVIPAEDAVIPEEDADVTEPEVPAEDAVIPEEDADVTEPEVPAEDAVIPEEDADVTEPEVPEEEETPAAEPGEPVPVENEEPAAETEEPTETSVPEITSMAIAVGNDTYGEVDSDNIVITAPGGTLLSDCTVTLTTSEAPNWTVNNSPAAGDLYVSAVSDGSVTLNFNLSYEGVDLNSSDYALTLTSSNDSTWTGGFGSTALMTLDGLAAILASNDIQLAAGAMNGTSEERTLLVNRDSANTMLILCAPDAAIYTVTYVVDKDTSIVWDLPAGIAMPVPALALDADETLNGWYTDSDHTIPLEDNVTVTSSATVYADITVAEPTDFLTRLKKHEAVTIESEEDWAVFVANSSEAVAGQLVTLGLDIDCGGAKYTSMTFAGNFNGDNHIIYNATFSAASGSENSGMFDTIGAGQKVCNLILSDITVNYGTKYSGALVGLLKGSGALVQNVQVYDCTVYGRGAGAIVGLIEGGGQVKYCASYDCSVRGAAVAGGIAGFTHATITQSCSVNASCTAIQLNATGGIVGKNVYGGRITSCWTDDTDLYGYRDDWSSDSNCLTKVNSETTIAQFKEIGLDSNWDLAKGTDTSLNMESCRYRDF